MLFFKFSIAALLAPLAVSAGPVRRGGNMIERQDIAVFPTLFSQHAPPPAEPTSVTFTNPAFCDIIGGPCI